jgi:C4-dicarboxylate-specific signal transduction histidine kinase
MAYNKDEELIEEIKDILVNEECNFSERVRNLFEKVAYRLNRNKHRIEKILAGVDKRESLFLQRHLNLVEKHEIVEHLLKEKSLKMNILENMLQEASKMAVMGEMIDAIAHQWKQPLGIISLYSKMIVNDFQYGDVNEDYLDTFSGKMDIQIGHLLETLSEFRDFFRPEKEKELFSISEAIRGVLILMGDTLKGNQITVKIDEIEDFRINGSINEFKHILINLFNNSKDAFVENSISNRVINVRIRREKNGGIVEISDNAGGIPVNIIKKIFHLNFSTKSSDKGSGVGLYMTKMIIDKLNGKISVDNFDNGVKFLIEFSQIDSSVIIAKEDN